MFSIPLQMMLVAVAGWAYGSNIQPNHTPRCVKRLDLLAAGHLWSEFGTHAMGCGDEVHTIIKLLTHHDFRLG